MSMRKALTIAGSDSGGGAGIQADLKTFQELRVFGMSAITAVTAQNTLGVHGVYPLSAEAVAAQIRAIGEDMGTDAVKTGMLFDCDIIEAAAEQIRRFGWRNVVVDPVMIAKGGASLLREEAIDALRRALLPLAEVVTPNLPEAEALTGVDVRTTEGRKRAARELAAMGARHVVVKGGHGEEPDAVVDLLYDGERFVELTGRRAATSQTHGTGCTFAAAIAAELAKGSDAEGAVRTAKAFIQAAVEEELGIGGGHGPTNHWAYMDRERRRTEGGVLR
ncbi:bifunctional hydroxymethylpyrimidine kinase/phosphomethylpyrimidine kinase [Paenibacillus sp.]|uniref:bifunctional hydroxymethylpyrimidine kinase/phosphomethylpyrimidine kinase n=1 Tax=Paenibacillus sp. TaxID=58172 RepID=UPI002D25C604|nr:bifunctional hydroxymethylpyrimidine kinase/phosphomethylpyrimidine kinase [Paenibacillus sp.]HZG86561.1 bifunctional hydroxymethylpyrimidine kinase/phosphomethylpyrimidine kinase [Paenibacillus sp.]